MSDEGSGQREALHVQIIAELRSARDAQWGSTSWSMRVTGEELDALLAAVSERDALKRLLAADPDEATSPRMSRRVDTTCVVCGKPIRYRARLASWTHLVAYDTVYHIGEPEA